MKICKDGRKIAFTLDQSHGRFFAALGDVEVYEENTLLGGDPYKLTAVFVTLGDAIKYLEAKYGGTVEER